MTDLHPVDVDGATIQMKRPTDGQLSAMSRAVLVMDTGEIDAVSKMRALNRLEDIIMSLVPANSEKEILEKALIEGRVELIHVFRGVFNGLPGVGPEPKKVVRRGRPRKSA